MKKEILNLRISALICGLILFCSAVFAEGDIHVLKISAQDQRAVVKMGDGKLQVVKVGDILYVASERVPGSELKEKSNDKSRVASYELRVVEIAEGRVVFEEQTEQGTETVIVRLEGNNAGSGLRVAGSESKKKQRIERIKKAGEKQQQLYAVKTPQEQKTQSKVPVKEKTRRKDRK